MFGFTTLAIAAATAIGHRNSVHASDEMADPPRAETEERLLQGGVLPGAGCYPTFSASMLYTKGSLVSAILTTRTPTTYESCSGYTDGCNGAYRKVGGEQVTAKYNWKCESAVRCTQAGFEPSSENGAWTRMEECDASAPPLIPLAPSSWERGGCPPIFSSGDAINAGDTISVNGLVYQCSFDLNVAQWCGMTGYEPGTGQYWKDAWTTLGSCDGTLAPTDSPVYVSLQDLGGCPDAWDQNVVYEEGDTVSAGEIVFVCKTWPFSGHCGQAGYEPGLTDGVTAWKDAWAVFGYCSGSIGPTSSPAFDTLDNVGGCPDAWQRGSNIKYEEGDMVSIYVSDEPIRRVVYKCKAWPYSGFCGQFAPTEYGGNQGWNIIGSCDGTNSPTQSPIFDTLTIVTDGYSSCPQGFVSGTQYDEGDRISYTVSTIPERKVVYECKSFPASQWCSLSTYAPGQALLESYVSMAWKPIGACEGAPIVTFTTLALFGTVLTMPLPEISPPPSSGDGLEAYLFDLKEIITSNLEADLGEGFTVVEVIIYTIGGVSVQDLLLERRLEEQVGQVATFDTTVISSCVTDDCADMQDHIIEAVQPFVIQPAPVTSMLQLVPEGQTCQVDSQCAGNHLCVNRQCGKSCGSNDDCVGSLPCLNGFCGRKSEGEQCLQNNECNSFRCSDGACKLNAERTVLGIGIDATGKMLSGSVENNDIVAVNRVVKKKTISGKGRGIGGIKDSFVYAKQTLGPHVYLADSFELEVHIVKSSASDFGLMIRENEEPSGRHFSAVMTQSNGARAMYRSTHEDNSISIPSSCGLGNDWDTDGIWLKIERSREHFRAYCMVDSGTEDDQDITNYVVLGETTIKMDSSVHVGIFLAMNDGATADGQVEFDNYSLKQTAMAVTRSIGQGVSGSLSDPVAFLDGRATTLSGQGGTGLQGGGPDSFIFTSIKAIETLQAEIFTVEVLIRQDSLSLQDVSFGLMVRDSLDASSRHFSAMFSKDIGAPTMLSRGAGTSSIIDPSGIKIPSGTDLWLRIDRSSREFRAYYKMAGFSELRTDLIEASECPIGRELTENECQDAAAELEVGEFDGVWNRDGAENLPCGCFLWQYPSYTKVLYRNVQAGCSARPSLNLGMICKKVTRVTDYNYKRIGSATNDMTTTVEIGVVLTSPQAQASVAFSSFSLSFGASTFQLVSQSGSRSMTWCLQAPSGSGEKLYTSSCHASSLYQTFRYEDSVGLIVSSPYSALEVLLAEDIIDNTFSAENKCVELSGLFAVLRECNMENPQQRFIYYNNQFHLSTDDTRVLTVSDTNRWTKGSTLSYLPKAIILTGSIAISPLCLEASTASPIAHLANCIKSRAQEWSSYDCDGPMCKIKHISTGKCLSRVDTNLSIEESIGMQLELNSCGDGEYWEWKDGSIFFESNYNYIIEQDGTDLLIAYVANDRVRSGSQRFLVGPRRFDNSYHEDTNSIRIRNDAAVPVECSFSQVGPLWWGVIYPGEEIYRNTGAVHWTVKCVAAMDGKGQIVIGDAVWPIADLVIQIAIAVATFGMSAPAQAGANAAKAAATIVQAAKAGLAQATAAFIAQVMKGNDFASAMEVFGIMLASEIGFPLAKIGVFRGASSIAGRLGSLFRSSAITPQIGASRMAFTSQRNKGLVGVAGLAGRRRVPPPPKSSSLAELIATNAFKNSAIKTASAGLKAAGRTVYYDSLDSVYANGKMFVVRGGPAIMQDGVRIEEPLRLEPNQGERKLLFERCDDDSDCIHGDCGRLKRGDDNLYCCDETSLFGGYYYCEGLTPAGVSCWFDEQCMNEGYCDSNPNGGANICYDPKTVGEACDNDNECENSVAYCNDVCTAKLKNGEACPGGDDEQCLTNACGIMGYDRDGDYKCCAIDTITVWFPGGGISCVLDFCSYTQKDKEVCLKNDHCEGGYCMGSDGLGTEGRCLGPYEVGQDCSEGGGEDDQCISKRCGLEAAGSDKYVCCAGDTVDHGFIDYCDGMEEGVSCWLDAMCKHGYCGGNALGLLRGKCVAKGSVENRGACHNGDDDMCQGDLACALDQVDGEYICCSNYGNWGDKQYCYDMPDGNICYSDAMCKEGYCADNFGGLQRGKCMKEGSVGDRGECYEGDDDVCQGDLACALDQVDGSYICCSNYGNYNGKEYCYDMPDGNICYSDAMCKHGYCADNFGGLQRGKCMKEGSVGDRGECYEGDDDLCQGDLACALDQVDGEYICCSNYGNWLDKQYCYDMPDGNRCHSDAMCGSDSVCLDDVCSPLKFEGQACDSQDNDECKDGSCNRATRDGQYTCCVDTNFCHLSDPGCDFGYNYCANWGSRLGLPPKLENGKPCSGNSMCITNCCESVAGLSPVGECVDKANLSFAHACAIEI